LHFFSCDLSHTRELTDIEGDITTETDSSSMESSLEVDNTTDHDSGSESDLWERFDFPQLTEEEDVQLTIALQGDTSHPTTSSTYMSPHEAMPTMDFSYMCSGVQDTTGTDQGASTELGPSSSPPPYMSESNSLQPVNSIFLINSNSMIPMSSTDGQFYVAINGVYHLIRQM
jgi:hypothetical protein